MQTLKVGLLLTLTLLPAARAGEARYDNGVVGPSCAYYGFGFRGVRAAGQ